ncbi:transcriptional repressor [Marinilactibacillus sp. 15R]|uniref:Fur family transcriptional regulator, ferric uptake regulator n=1 Tax=Marinilactibacillus piezotolerans TaxID=258723 RepID=A0A1I3VP32_9LACT|nr:MULTISPECIES: Fur family transcriptional regulator [Marinilactibacillus]API89288.1 transcriptional repressor [Marinilactibacillus sp. 15R]SFJ97138.1 Fur family transcriptional regulator, ferric uptake regulator [Marinilactibacillus piezotolerans]
MEKTDTTIQKVKQKIYKAGYKLTSQREDILRVLLDNEHLSAEEIYLKVKSENSGIGLATVYRTLELLSELNIINKIAFQDGISRYDVNDNDRQHQHHYLLCLNCGKIDEVEKDMLIDVEKEVEKSYHFKIKDHRLTFHGLCKKCIEEADDQNKG